MGAPSAPKAGSGVTLLGPGFGCAGNSGEGERVQDGVGCFCGRGCMTVLMSSGFDHQMAGPICSPLFTLFPPGGCVKGVSVSVELERPSTRTLWRSGLESLSDPPACHQRLLRAGLNGRQNKK